LDTDAETSGQVHMSILNRPAVLPVPN